MVNLNEINSRVITIISLIIQKMLARNSTENQQIGRQKNQRKRTQIAYVVDSEEGRTTNLTLTMDQLELL